MVLLRSQQASETAIVTRTEEPGEWLPVSHMNTFVGIRRSLTG
jgi:hypothetical protein